MCLLLTVCGTLHMEIPDECPVHEISLDRQLVPARSGAPRHEYLKAREALFPYPGTSFTGEINPATTESMLSTPVCGACRRAERDWLRENRWK